MGAEASGDYDRTVTEFELRRGVPHDAAAAVEVWLKSRLAASKYIPATVHPDDETRAWMSTHVLLSLECWVAETPAREIIGLLVLHGDWIEQLYVSPAWQGHGIGGALVELAKQLRPEGLQLWAFVSNTPARRFYEHRGFVCAEETDGSANEERAPDMRYVYRPRVPPA